MDQQEVVVQDVAETNNSSTTSRANPFTVIYHITPEPKYYGMRIHSGSDPAF
jgi:hypothetical protein